MRTLYLTYNGVFVNDCSFEALPTGSRVCVTMVLTKDNEGRKMAHEHLRLFPELEAMRPDC